MTKRLNLLFALLFIVVIALFLWLIRDDIMKGLSYQSNMPATATTVIIALLVVTLVVERAAAVVNAIIFGEEERQAEYERIQAAKGAGDSASAEAKLKVVLDKKARVRLVVSFVGGLFVSAAGVRTLEGLLVLPQSPVVPSPLFYPVDIVMTAALIAGGSKSLAFLAAVLRDLVAPPPQAPAAGAPSDGVKAVPPATPPARPVSVGPRLV
jgi:hypothetical protein